jgi:hypothetical protein
MKADGSLRGNQRNTHIVQGSPVARLAASALLPIILRRGSVYIEHNHVWDSNYHQHPIRTLRQETNVRDRRVGYHLVDASAILINKSARSELIHAKAGQPTGFMRKLIVNRSVNCGCAEAPRAATQARPSEAGCPTTPTRSRATVSPATSVRGERYLSLDWSNPTNKNNPVFARPSITAPDHTSRGPQSPRWWVCWRRG